MFFSCLLRELGHRAGNLFRRFVDEFVTIAFSPLTSTSLPMPHKVYSNSCSLDYAEVFFTRRVGGRQELNRGPSPEANIAIPCVANVKKRTRRTLLMGFHHHISDCVIEGRGALMILHAVLMKPLTSNAYKAGTDRAPRVFTGPGLHSITEYEAP